LTVNVKTSVTVLPNVTKENYDALPPRSKYPPDSLRLEQNTLTLLIKLLRLSSTSCI